MRQSTSSPKIERAGLYQTEDEDELRDGGDIDGGGRRSARTRVTSRASDRLQLGLNHPSDCHRTMAASIYFPSSYINARSFKLPVEAPKLLQLTAASGYLSCL